MRTHPETHGRFTNIGGAIQRAAWVCLATIPFWNLTTGIADEPAAKPYSDAVVSKAEKILGDVGLKRSGRSLVALKATEAARTLGQLESGPSGAASKAEGRGIG